MDAETLTYFRDHVKALEARALDGDEDAIKSLCCMVLIREYGSPPPEGDGLEFTTFQGDVVDLAEWMKRRAA